MMMSKQIPVHDVTRLPAGKDSVDLYASREKIYTRAFTGLFRNLRMVGGAFVPAVLRHRVAELGPQAVWWNLPERKFYIFGATIWPQDFILLGPADRRGLRPVLHHRLRRPRLVRLYLPAKRVDLDLHVVRKGHRRRPQPAHEAGQGAHERQQVPAQVRQAQPVAADRLRHRHDLRRLLLADPRTGHRLLHRPGRWLVYFWVGFFTLATYGNAGWLREQVCIYMCPYARFQSVMFDKDTLIVSYDPRRGEPWPA
jgi:hypothetical protein